MEPKKEIPCELTQDKPCELTQSYPCELALKLAKWLGELERMLLEPECVKSGWEDGSRWVREWERAECNGVQKY